MNQKLKIRFATSFVFSITAAVFMLIASSLTVYAQPAPETLLPTATKVINPNPFFAYNSVFLGKKMQKIDDSLLFNHGPIFTTQQATEFINNIMAKQKQEEIEAKNKALAEAEALRLSKIPKAPTGRYSLSAAEQLAVCRVVANESGGEPYKGKLAVAQSIRDRCIAANKRPTSILVEGQFAVDASTPITDEVRSAVNAVFNKGQLAVAQNIEYFYAPSRCSSSWHESLTYVTTIGGHRFFA